MEDGNSAAPGGSVVRLLLENRRAVIDYLTEKLAPALLDAQTLSQVLSPAEVDQVRSKQGRQQKAACLVDIVIPKLGIDHITFVDTLRMAHRQIHVPELLHQASSDSLQVVSMPSLTSPTEIEYCVRAGDVLHFRDMKDRHRQHIVCSVTSGSSVLHHACQSGMLPMVMEVIQAEQEFGCNRTSVDKEITLCVDLGHHQLIQPLLEYGAVDVNNVIPNGKSLTERAAVNGHIDTFRELERHGAIPSDTVIALASAENRLPFLQDLLTSNHVQRSNYNLNFQDRRRKCSAHFAAEKGNPEVVRLLLEKGLDINLKDKRDFTILHSAASGGSVATVEAVLEACEHQHVRHRMLTARDRYLGSERCFFVRWHDNDQPAWHYVEADRGCIDIFRKKTQGGPVDVAKYGIVKRSGWGTNPTPEIMQEVEGLYDVVNADPNGPEDMQPLHVSIIKNHEPVTLKLISVMGDVGEPDCFGLTPLHLAAMMGHVNAIKALLAKGAQHQVADQHGRTPLDIAKINDQQEVVKLLKLHAQVNAIEHLLRGGWHELDLQRLQQRVQEGGDAESYLLSICRDLIAGLSDYIWDNLHQTSVVSESGMA